MKLRTSGTKTKIGIFILLFSFILFPISQSISLAENGGTGAASGGEETGAAPGQAEAAGAAAAQAGVDTGLSSGTIAALIVAAVIVAFGTAIAISDDDEAPAVTPPAHH